MKIRIILISFIMILWSDIFPQNITNTLGTSGTFTIKDGSANYFTLSQSTGNVGLLRNLELGNIINSTPSVGVITKNGVRFMHNYQAPATDGFNTFIGLTSGNFTMAGTLYSASYNTGVGYGTLSSISLGFGNSAFGYQSLFSNAEGYDNTAIGILALTSNTSGYENTAVGNGSLTNNTTGYNNTAIGSVTLHSNTTGYENTAVGINSLSINNGFRNTAVGTESLTQNSTGNYNSALGYQSLKTNSNGIYNCAFGSYSLLNNSTGHSNTALGNWSLYSNTIGYNNTALGVSALNDNTSGINNTAVGHLSLSNNTTGFQNTVIGYSCGSNITTGTSNTLIGYDAEPSSGTVSNQITLGGSFVTSLRCNVTTITSLSDMRDKKNISDLSLGLDFLMNVKPRLFNWDKREWYDNNISDGSKMQEESTAGFIAQELDEVQTKENAQWLNLVLKDNPEKWEATPGNLLPIMVKAIQQLKQENDKLKSDLDSLKTVNERIAKLEIILSDLDLKVSSIEELNTAEK